MGRARKARPGEGQRAFQLDARVIPPDYDEILARRAAMRRYQVIRQVGGSIAVKRTAGFRSATRGLWIPHSKGENTAVVSPPETKVHQEGEQAKQRVKEKYEDSDHSPGKVRNWANASARQSRIDRRFQYRKFFKEADSHLHMLMGGLATDRTFTPDTIRDAEANFPMSVITAHQLALNGLINHYWLQKNWTKKRGAAFTEAYEKIVDLSDDALMDLYDEVVWSTWSRKNYWEAKVFQPKVEFDPTLIPELVGPFELAEPPLDYDY